MHKEELSTFYMEEDGKETYDTDSKNMKHDNFSEIISVNNMVNNDALNDSVSDIEAKETSDCTFNTKEINAGSKLKFNIKKKTNNEFACKYCSKIIGKKLYPFLEFISNVENILMVNVMLQERKQN